MIRRGTGAALAVVAGVVGVFANGAFATGTSANGDAKAREEHGATASPTATTSPTATLATSFDELARLVADPNGPAEIELASGTHRGDLVIRRALVLRGHAGAVLEGSGTGTVVTIDAHDVTVEDLAVRNSGRKHTAEDAGIKATGARVRIARVDVSGTLFGVSLQACRSCVLEGARITGYDDDTELRGDGIKLWESHDSVVRDCHVTRSRDLVVWYTRRATLEEVVVEKSRYGAHFMYAHDAVVRRSKFENDVVGVFVMYSMRVHVEDNVLAGARGAAGVGIGFKDSDAIDVRRNWLVANTTGTYLDNTPRSPADPVHFEANVLALNDVALRLHGAEKGLHFRGNDFRNNAAVLEIDGGGDALGVDVRGNHFSNYEGYDLDGDGIGDVAYEVKALSSELTESHPSLKFFHGTAAMGVIDAVAHAVPVLSAKTLLVDPAPLVAFTEAKSP